MRFHSRALASTVVLAALGLLGCRSDHWHCRKEYNPTACYESLDECEGKGSGVNPFTCFGAEHAWCAGADCSDTYQHCAREVELYHPNPPVPECVRR
jgi:hypothetical protein